MLKVFQVRPKKDSAIVKSLFLLPNHCELFIILPLEFLFEVERSQVMNLC